MMRYFLIALCTTSLIMASLGAAECKKVQTCYDCICRDTCCRDDVWAQECLETFLCGGFFIRAEYLYWKAREDNLEFAIDGLGVFGSAVSLSLGGQAHQPDWRWHSGFRLGAGYLFPCSCWDLFINYTRYFTSACGNASNANSEIWTTFGSPLGLTAVFSAFADWDLHFQSVDIEFGTICCCGDCYSLRPFGGLAIVWTKEEYDILYDNRPTENTFEDIRNKQTFKGVGPKIGIGNDWCFWDCISLFANGAISLLWGDYDVDRIDFLQITPPPIVVVHTGEDFFALRALLDFKLGLRYNKCLCDRYRLYVSVAYENQVFLRHNQFFRFMAGSFGNLTQPRGNFIKTNSDLSLYGLTASLGLGF